MGDRDRDKDAPGFTVKDRRVSAEEPSSAHAEGDHAEPALPASEGDLPPIDFHTFVLSLSTSAMLHLGLIPNTPDFGKPNLSLARQTIDLLTLLEQKTTGNLTGEEERLLSEVLFDLRVRYVKLTKKD